MGPRKARYSGSGSGSVMLTKCEMFGLFSLKWVLNALGKVQLLHKVLLHTFEFKGQVVVSSVSVVNSSRGVSHQLSVKQLAGPCCSWTTDL